MREARERIIDLVVWNQRMAGVPSPRERVAAMYEAARKRPLIIPVSLGDGTDQPEPEE